MALAESQQSQLFTCAKLSEAVEEVAARLEQAFDARLTAEAIARQALQETISMTDEFLQRVLDRLESVKTEY
jgi:hypothetical protein